MHIEGPSGRIPVVGSRVPLPVEKGVPAHRQSREGGGGAASWGEETRTCCLGRDDEKGVYNLGDESQYKMRYNTDHVKRPLAGSYTNSNLIYADPCIRSGTAYMTALTHVPGGRVICGGDIREL